MDTKEPTFQQCLEDDPTSYRTLLTACRHETTAYLDQLGTISFDPLDLQTVFEKCLDRPHIVQWFLDHTLIGQEPFEYMQVFYDCPLDAAEQIMTHFNLTNEAVLKYARLGNNQELINALDSN